MKKILNYISFLLIGIMLFASCTKEEGATALSIVSNTVTNGPLANEGIIQLTSSNFTASVEDDWCSLEIENDKIIVRTTQNEEKVNRSTLIHIVPTAGGDKIIVPITQRGLLFEVNATAEVLSYSLKGGIKKLNVISNIDYKVEFSEDWMSYEVVGDTLYLKAEPIKDIVNVDYQRMAKTSIVYGDSKYEFDIYQYTIYDYNDFLGDGYISFINEASLDETKRVRIPVMITPKVDGRVFTVSTTGLSNMGNLPVKFDVNINSDNSLEIVTGQLVADDYVEPLSNDKTNQNKVKIYAVAYNVANKIFGSTKEPLLKATSIMENGNVVYPFKAQGQWAVGTLLPKYYSADGLVINAHRYTGLGGSSRYSNISPYLYIMDLRLEK